MGNLEIFLSLLIVVAGVAWAATRVGIAYPILLVLAGLVIGLVPGLPEVQLDPQLVFILFLPPLLYFAGLMTSWRDFRENLRPIALLSVGLVLFTTALVAAAVMWLVPGFTWAAAFVLGAIVSPPDAVAATAIMHRLRIPKRIVTIVEGESLVNDATALVAYQFAVAAVLEGTFSWQAAAVGFVSVSIGGIAVGLLAGWVIAKLRPRIKDPAVDTTVSLLTPYISYLPANTMQLSGVLAAVTTGIFLSRHVPKIIGARARMRNHAVWETLEFLLNGIIFVLIGLQLPAVMRALADQPLSRLLWYGGAISFVAIAVRMLWVFPATYLPRWFSPALRQRDPVPPWQPTFIVAWCGMRGIVSLAAALALPLTLESGDGFPARDLIIFITFCVILVTLVLQGLSLPWLIKRFKLSPDDADDQEDLTARHASAVAVLVRLGELEFTGQASPELIARFRTIYDERVKGLVSRLDDERDPAERRDDEHLRNVRSLHADLLRSERASLLVLRDQGVIGDAVMRRIQEELDLEEWRVLHDD